MTEPTKRRGRGEGSVYQDGSRWVGVADLGTDPVTHRRIRRKVTGRTKTEARKKLTEMLAEHHAAGTVPRGDLTVGHLVDELLEHPPAKWRSPISVRVNAEHARRAAAALGTVRAAKLTVAQVEAFLGSLVAQGYSQSTVVRAKGVLRLALRRAQRDHGLARNVADLAEMPAASARKSKSMTRAQVESLLALELSTWWRAYLSVAFMCGLRPGEILALRWEDADTAAGTLSVRHSLSAVSGTLVLSELKTVTSKRTLVMPAAVVTALKAHRTAQAAQKLAAGPAWLDTFGLIFASPRSGAPRWRTAVDREYKGLCERAGLGRDWQLRETRHTFVSVLSDAGVNIEAIADAAGHATSRVTQAVYRHQLSDQIAAAAVAWDQPKAQEAAQ